MSLTEFDLIEQYFHRPTVSSVVVTGMGDDAAVLAIPPSADWVTSVDTLVESVHFFAGAPPEAIGYKSLAVSLSDMAAMGAEPKVALLAITLPTIDKSWLKAFTSGFFGLADRFQVALIGGNVTRGPLTVSVVVDGAVPKGRALLRSGAKEGDLIYVTGTLGDAGLALDKLKQDKPCEENLLQRYYYPSPRVFEGMALRDIATAAIDISDGLVADVEKLCQASCVGAHIQANDLPVSTSNAVKYALTAGDDYELCFTVSTLNRARVKEIFSEFKCGAHCVGEITKQMGVVVFDASQQPMTIRKKGYEHF